RALGADEVTDYSRDDFSRAAWDLSARKGVNVAANSPGADTFNPSLRAPARHGRLLVCGATAGCSPQVDLRYLWRRGLQVLGSTGYTQQDIGAAVDMVATGKLKPVIGRVFPLRQAAEAVKLLEDRAFFGKIVIVP